MLGLPFTDDQVCSIHIPHCQYEGAAIVELDALNAIEIDEQITARTEEREWNEPSLQLV